MSRELKTSLETLRDKLLETRLKIFRFETLLELLEKRLDMCLEKLLGEDAFGLSNLDLNIISVSRLSEIKSQGLQEDISAASLVFD